MKAITFLTITVAGLFNAAYAIGNLDGLTDVVSATGALDSVGGGLLGGSKAKADPQSVDDNASYKKMRRNFVAKKRGLPLADNLPGVSNILGGGDKAKPADDKNADDNFPGSEAFKTFPSSFEDSKPKTGAGLGAGLLDNLPVGM